MLEPSQVLLVEDDASFADLTVVEIEAHAGEFAVRRAATLAAALRAIREAPVDAVLLDLGLPDSDGLSTLSAIQRALPRNVPVVVLTARDDMTTARNAMQAGAQDYLVKGRADEDDLIRSLRYAIERSSVQGRLLEAEEALRVSEARLRQAQKMEAVGRLAGGIAHDFNNVLTAIFGYADLLMDSLDLLDPRRADAAEIKRAAERAAGLTRQLLAFSRKQVMQPRLVNLNTVVHEMGGMLRRVVGERIALRLDLDQGLGHVTADPGQLEQVIANLGVNARDAMPDGGTLTIATANVNAPGVAGAEDALPPGGPLVALTVSDTGTGMDEHVLAHLFEPFFTTKELGRGTGLGLATVYGIVRQSGGQIQVASRPGEGSTFTVYFPRVEADPRAASTTALPEPSPGGTETVLVVEDEAAVRHLCCRVLRAKGYRVLEAPHAEAALALVAAMAEPIHLLVTDMVMPGMGGPALAAQLVATRPTLRVLYITGYALEAIEQGGDVAGADGLLQKPFSADQLARTVRELLGATR